MPSVNPSLLVATHSLVQETVGAKEILEQIGDSLTVDVASNAELPVSAVLFHEARLGREPRYAAGHQIFLPGDLQPLG